MMMGTSLDPAILAVLPKDCQVMSLTRHGTGSWADGYRLEIKSGDEKLEYFLKVYNEPKHFELARGEFESQKELQEYIPENASTPLAYGKLERSPLSFFLTLFRKLHEDIIVCSKCLAQVFSKLYELSSSPNGKFGFHVTTFNGVVPMANDWCDSWEEFYGRQMRSDIQWLHSICGPDSEFDEVFQEFFERVIPRLLRPLETGGRSIKPTLLHGDAWSGNIQTDEETGQVIFFDSCCFYGHNELDLGMMCDPRYRFGEEHVKAYQELVPKSEPQDDFSDRQLIYAMRDNIINLGLHYDKIYYFRDEIIADMRRLIAKYPNGIDGFVG
ncbi:Fructosamine kinase-domain-containing protein [Xylariaceae sp. FL1272]|nr:Fructosamine kinase-domain-containing protein [Xylariaceae sp. FL1272]